MWINNYFKYQILNPVFLSDVANITICFDISDSGCRGKFLKSRKDRFLMKFYDYVTFSQHVQFFIKAMFAMSSLPDVRVLWKKNLSPASVPNFYYLLYLTRNLLSENLFFFSEWPLCLRLFMLLCALIVPIPWRRKRSNCYTRRQ